MSDEPVARILIADDEPLFLRTTTQLLYKAGYDCVGVPDGAAALERLAAERFDLILSDLKMPGNLKLELLHEGRERWPAVPLIVVTGAPSLPSAIESVRLGITDYLLKPVKYDDLLATVRRSLAQSRRASPPPTTSMPPTEPRPVSGRPPALIGESPKLRELAEIIERVAATDANILITGESGTGKEVVAGIIHSRSLRAEQPFQVVDCTAVPEPLFESVLFGHVKGSFTGAVKDQIGLLSGADGGTAFFDEIGELPLPLQAKLLRVIQEQTFLPVGQTTEQRIDTRFICATNRDLAMEVDAGRFRRDLYYRLAVIHIELPPLRERGDDVVLLAQHFLRGLAGAGRATIDFADDALEALRRYPWPGNIRELRNAVEHALAVSRAETIRPDDFPATLRRHGPKPAGDATSPSSTTSSDTTPAALSRTDAEKAYLVALLQRHEGNVSRAAIEAGMSRQGLHKLLKSHDIAPAEHRPGA